MYFNNKKMMLPVQAISNTVSPPYHCHRKRSLKAQKPDLIKETVNSIAATVN